MSGLNTEIKVLHFITYNKHDTEWIDKKVQPLLLKQV